MNGILALLAAGCGVRIEDAGVRDRDAIAFDDIFRREVAFRDFDANDTADTPPVLAPLDVQFADRGPATGACVATPSTPPLCPDLCGNHVIDMCTTMRSCGPGEVDAGFGFCPQISPEPCDETGSPSCFQLGFRRGGESACTQNCLVDTSGCERCSNDSHIARCDAPAPHQAVSANFGLSADSDRVALAWASVDPGHMSPGALQLAVFDTANTTVARSPCLGPMDVRNVSVAPAPDGWLAAYEARAVIGEETAIYLQRFDANAQPLGSPAFVALGANPRLTAGDGTVSLLEYEWWQRQGASWVIASVLHADGTPTGSQSAVFSGEFGLLDFASAVWIGDSFLLAVREDDPIAAITVRRIEADGRLGPPVHPAGTMTEWPQLLRDGEWIAMTYLNFAATNGPHAVVLDPQGNAVGSPVDLVAAGAGLRYEPMYAALHDGGFVVVGRDQSTDGLSAASFDQTFHLRGTPWPVGRGGVFSSNDRARITSTPTHVIHAWTEAERWEEHNLAMATMSP